jgi:hypothetical protein
MRGDVPVDGRCNGGGRFLNHEHHVLQSSFFMWSF